MATNFPSADQRVSPTQVWAQLTPDLQVHIIRLVAQLAAHLVLAARGACSTRTKGDP